MKKLAKYTFWKILIVAMAFSFNCAVGMALADVGPTTTNVLVTPTRIINVTETVTATVASTTFTFIPWRSAWMAGLFSR